ncbi:MAG: hypothetical protein V1253_02705, partial [Alphaproteobacteria bacterium]|nr:hypothetical protein [Alphaproteobacteria bacterium]MEE1568743.1 hypothetical protein [Alphaproteobacteria bacterium]
PVRYQGMDMGMKGDQITEGLHKQDISGFAPGRDLFVDGVYRTVLAIGLATYSTNSTVSGNAVARPRKNRSMRPWPR